MKVTFDQHIGIFENAVPKEWCNEVIELFEKNIFTSKTRKDIDNVPPIEKQDLFHNLLDNSSSHCRDFSRIFWEKVFPLYAHEYKLENVIDGNLFVDDFKLQKTKLSEGYHSWHCENTTFKSEYRKREMVYTLYLNDVEEGGETEFLVQSKRVKPKQGTLCIFPAGYTHIHRGNPPLSNIKYIMTGWISYVDEPSQISPPLENE